MEKMVIIYYLGGMLFLFLILIVRHIILLYKQRKEFLHILQDLKRQHDEFMKEYHNQVERACLQIMKELAKNIKLIMKADKEKIKNDILLDKYTARGFIDTCNAINDLHLTVFQGYQGETAKAEAWCEHCFCEFVLGYLDMVSHYLIDLHDLQEKRNNQNDK